MKNDGLKHNSKAELSQEGNKAIDRLSDNNSAPPPSGPDADNQQKEALKKGDTAPRQQQSSSRRRWVIRLVVLGLVLGLLWWVTVRVRQWALTRAGEVPAVYLPPTVAEDELEELEHSGIRIYQTFYNQVNLNQRFAVALPWSLLNRLLMHPEVDRFLSEKLEDKAVRVSGPQVYPTAEMDGIRFMARVSWQDRETVITIPLRLSVDGDSDRLRIHLSWIRAGELPIPMWLIREQLSDLTEPLSQVEIPEKEVVTQTIISEEESGNLQATYAKWIGLVQALIRQGEVTIETVFPVTPDERYGQLEKIAIDRDYLTLTINPVAGPLPRSGKESAPAK